MKIISQVIILIFIGCGKSFSQSPSIKIDFFLDDKKINSLGHAEIAFIKEQDTIRAVIGDGTFTIPKELVHTKTNTIVSVNKYKGTFSLLPLMWNPELPHWEIHIDTKPFNPEKTWWLKDTKRKNRIKIIYILDIGNGLQFSEYRYKI